jgi:two-component system NtrC family sensor kinase
MSNPLLHFDRDVSLTESLSVVPHVRLERALSNMLGSLWEISETDGTHVLGPGISHTGAVLTVPLRIDIEVAGQLRALNVSQEQMETAAQWIELVLIAFSRYRMAADLHIETSRADFEALQRQYEALLQSEARYRELAEQLDQRVQSQVAIIELKQRQLYQSEKMAAVGSLAAGMAHEINNPIGFIRSNLSTASRYMEEITEMLATLCRSGESKMPTSDKKPDIDFILSDFSSLLSESVTGANRIASIVANLKAFANVDSISDANVDVNDVIRAVVAVIRDRLPMTIAVEMDLQPLPYVFCDRGRMNQALFSIIQNAHQAIGDKGGVIRISSRTTGDEIHIKVSDDGCGIEPETLNRIYDPFFTTRDVGQGTGLGLTISRDIVMAHSGRIEANSEPGIGSVFTICLPHSGGIENEQKESTS